MMRLLDRIFRAQAVEQILADTALLAFMLKVEAALAVAEAALGVIPDGAARHIKSCCTVESLDVTSIAEQAKSSGNVAIPLVKQLTAAVATRDREAAKYVHWGATSQDIIDTALVLQCRDAVAVIVRDLERACATLHKLTVRHRNTIMAGRTWLQHALPITFGLKTAQMLWALHRQAKHLRNAVDEFSALQFGGAAGTLAALGNQGPAVAEAMATHLGLTNPPMPWHTNRTPVGELATSLGLVCAGLGKIARDISLLTQTEIGEVSESSEGASGGSSTMPQKKNPVASAAILANVARVPGLVSTILTTMVQEHERGLGGWQAEWESLPEIVSLTGGAAERTAELLSGLEVHAEKMRDNVELTHGLIYSEAVSMALAKFVGKADAHALLEEAAREASQSHVHLSVVLRTKPGVSRHLSEQEIRELFDPERYLGATQIFIDRILGECLPSIQVTNAVG